MNNKSRLFRVVGAAALLVSMLAVTVAPAMAQDPPGIPGDFGERTAPFINITDPGFTQGVNAIFYPWVANDDDFGLGPADTSISVQNLSGVDAQMFIYVGDGAGSFALATTAYLSAWASRTFHASALGIDEGEGAPVAVTAWHQVVPTTTLGTWPTDLPGVPGAPTHDVVFAGLPANADILGEVEIILSNPIADEDAGGEFTQVLACVTNYWTTAQPEFGVPWGYTAAVDHTFAGDGEFYAAGEWVSFADNVNFATVQEALQATLNDVNDGVTDPDLLVNPFGGLNADGDCLDIVTRGPLGTGALSRAPIGGVAKQAVEGEGLPTTSGVDTAVSGYNAINGAELARFNEWYLPIVQTNCGPGGCWDSTIRVGNMSGINSAVTIRFFPADDGSGSLQTGFQLQGSLTGGDTWHVNLGDYVPDGWVGTAHILTDGFAFPMVDRYKVGYNMWITNTGSSAGFENAAQFENAQGRYALFAPHVLLDYFGWNTGINVANLAAQDNNVSIQYFNLLGNATEVLNQRLAAHGMTYFYDPSVPPQNIGQDPTFGEPVMTDPAANIVGSAIIWSDFPVAAAIDATKYPETDPTGSPDIFQATSYNATQNVFNWQAVPLIQKGSPTTGMGDTSGINFMNPNNAAATVQVFWVDQTGFGAANTGIGSVTIPAFANGFVYAMTQRNLPNGFTGAAVAVSDLPVVAASANVNYEVQFDGAAIFNSFNPCGFYRTAGPLGECFFGDPFDITGRSVTKTFVDQFGEPVVGVNFNIVGQAAEFPYQRDGVSGVDGSRIFTNVPVGNYELFVTSVPEGYVAPDPDVAQDTFTVTQGEDVVLENVIERELLGFTKTVVVEGTLGDDDDIVEGTEFVAGVDVIVYSWVGTGTDGFVTGAVQFTGQTDAEGMVGGNLVAGTYVLCLYDADGEATVNGTTVFPMLPAAPDRTFINCEEFTVDDDVVDLINEVDLFAQGIVKTVLNTECLVANALALQQVNGEVCFTAPVEGAAVVVLEGEVEVASDVTDASGVAAFALDPGTYTVCSTVGEGEAAQEICEPAVVELGGVVALTNEHDVEGILVDFGVLAVSAELFEGVIDEDEIFSFLADVEITVYEALVTEGGTVVSCALPDVFGAEVAAGVTDEDGEVAFGLEAGFYCVVADATATGEVLIATVLIADAEVEAGVFTFVDFLFEVDLDD